MEPGSNSPIWVNTAFERIELSRRMRRLQENVQSRRFSIFANNCWGGYVYQDLQIPYQTPFVGLYFHLSSFVGFLENFETAIRAPLEFVEESRHEGKVAFPVGLIMEKYEIHFMHFSSREEAKEKWNRRRDRIVEHMDDCFFALIYLKENYVEALGRFNRLPFRNKVLFTDHPMVEAPEAVVIPPPGGARGLDDGPTLYRRCHRYFDLAGWLNKDRVSA